MSPRTKERILIVDDDPDVVTLVTDLLAAQGYETLAARDGLEAILDGTARAERFDLVILDIMMPYAEGIGVLNALKAVRPDVPVIMLTAKTAPEDVERGYAWGCDAYVTKPFEPAFLLGEVERVLRANVGA
jgi:DNA-binding response OmpR family regulator